MATSTFMVSIDPIPIPSGCGCACASLCCLCQVPVCLRFTCPDWASWGCTPFGPIMPSGSGIEVTGAAGPGTTACDGGYRSYSFQYGDFPSSNYVLGSVSCNSDEATATVTINARFTCAFSPTGTFQVDYNGSFVVGITAGSTCSNIVTTTGSIPATLVFGSPPGSLSPASVVISSGACGTVAVASPVAAMTKAVALPCVYLSTEPLKPREAFELGLSPLREWRKCWQDYGVGGTDGNGYICGCAPWPDGGCVGCTSYVAVSQNSSEVESQLPDGSSEPNGG